MAEGYLKLYAENIAAVYSAGIETHGVNPKAIAVMKEDGVDISGHTSNCIDEYLHIPFDFVITVCDNAKERCPVFPGGTKRYHHSFPDPAKATGTQAEVDASFNAVRQQIKDYCRQFVNDHLNKVTIGL